MYYYIFKWFQFIFTIKLWVWRGWVRILELFRWVLGIFIVRMGRLVGPDGERTNHIRHQHLHPAHTILVAFTSLWREYKETGKLRSDISVILFLFPYARIWGIFLDFKNVLCLNSVHTWLVVLVHTLDWTTISHDFVLEEGNCWWKSAAHCDWGLRGFLGRFNMHRLLQAQAFKRVLPSYWCYFGRFWSLMDVLS